MVHDRPSRLNMNPDLWSVLNDAVSDAPDRPGAATGWSIHATGPRGSLSEAGGVDGLGDPVETGSMFHVYCAIKPLLAIAVAHLVDQRELSLNDRIGDLLGPPGSLSPELSSTTVWDLLTHHSGINEPSATASAILPPDQRAHIALNHPPAELDLNESAYTEAAAWIVLGLCIEELVDHDLVAWTETRILEPLGLQHDFDLESDNTDALRVNVTFTRGRRMPLLIELTEALSWRGNPGYGGRATTRGIAGLLDELMKAQAGGGRLLSEAAARQVLTLAPRRFDRTLGKECRFGGGVMADLGDHTFGDAPGPRSFGHGGLIGMTSAWCDPDTGVVACCHLNGLCHPSRSLATMRPRLVDQMSAAAQV